MLGERKSGGELVLQKETSSFWTAFVFRRRALCISKSSWHQPLLCRDRALANLFHFSPFRKLLAAHPRVVEQERGCHPHVTQVPLQWSPLWYPQHHPASSPCAVFFLFHVFLLLLLDSPSSGDDEDDDDESEDTGNLFLQHTESCFFKQRCGCHVAWLRHLLPYTLKWEPLGQEYRLLGPGTRNLEEAAEVV